MPATFTWRVTELGVENKTVDGHTDLVSKIYWRCTGEQEVNGVTYIANLERNTVIVYDPDHQYVLYPDLTETEALEWVINTEAYQDKDKQSVTVKTATETELQAMIDAQITPAIVTPALPWITQ